MVKENELHFEKEQARCMEIPILPRFREKDTPKAFP